MRRMFLVSALVALATTGEAQLRFPSNYWALSGCRIADTRLSAAGPLVPGQVRSLHVVGSTSDFAGQGGRVGGCGLPGWVAGPQVLAVAFNFVAVNPSGAGNLRAWATFLPVPDASILNYVQVPGLNIANAVIVQGR